MRWLVEVMTLGKTEKESLHVDGESWQKALQAARALRGETAPMSGFSIELSDEGCRAVDSASRLRYEVRRAVDEAPAATAGRASEMAAAASDSSSAAPSERSSPSQAPGPIERAAPAPSPASQPPRASKRPSLSPSAAAMMLGPPAVAAPRPSSAPASPQSAPTTVTSAPAQTRARADLGSSVPSQVVFKREEDATESVPLTYREYVFLVPLGTSEKTAEALLLTQLELVRASLARARSGKLVNLAVFDIAFHGKPTVPPISTLMWKDWRDDPVIEFPRRPGYTRPQSIPPAGVAPRLAAARPTPDQSAPTAAPPSAPWHPLATHEASEVLLHGVAPIVVPAAVTAVSAVAIAEPAPLDGSAHAAAVSAASAIAATAEPTTPNANTTPAATDTGPPANAPPADTSELTAPAIASVEPTAAAEATPEPEPTAPAAAPQRRLRVPSEELIADLFESMHELHFLRDALEGGEFCLGLAMEKIPSEAGIVHLYDIDRREFLVTSARGRGASTLLLRRHPEADAVLSAAMGKGRALVFADTTQSEAGALDRYAEIGGLRSLIVAPVALSGRFLGAIELLNPLDGQPYTEAEGNAVTYIAEQFAEFVESHGIVTDPQRIRSRAG